MADRDHAAACNLCGSTVTVAHDRLWTKDGHEIVRCPSCSLVFRIDLPADEELSAIYGPAYFTRDQGDTGGQGYADYVADAPLHLDAARARVRLLARYHVPGRLLDVGCAAGFFVHEARRAAWEASGIDISAEMVEWGRANLGVPLERRSFMTTSAEPGSLDALTMWDYLEHTTDPRRELELAASLVSAGGVLALSTGDVESVVARVSGRRWHLLTPRHHNFFFSRRTLERYLRETGFEVLELSRRGGRYSLEYLAHKARTLADVAPLRAAAAAIARSRVGSVAVPLNLFDIVTVVAVRR